MSMVGTDCYYFLYSASGCSNPHCSYRHQESTRSVNEICPLWQANPASCQDPHCSLRHSDYHLKRLLPRPRPVNGQVNTACFHEARHGQCYKADCPFVHQLPRGPNAAIAGVVRVEKRDGGFAMPPEETPHYAPQEQAISVLLKKEAIPAVPKDIPAIIPKKANAVLPTSPQHSPPLAASPSTPSFEVKSFAEIMREKQAKRAADQAEPVAKKVVKEAEVKPTVETLEDNEPMEVPKAVDKPAVSRPTAKSPVESKSRVKVPEEAAAKSPVKVAVKPEIKSPVKPEIMPPIDEIGAKPAGKAKVEVKSPTEFEVKSPTETIAKPPAQLEPVEAKSVVKPKDGDDFDIDRELAELDELLAK